MSAATFQLPFLKSSGLLRANRRIALAVQRKQDLAVMIVCVRGVERLCAAIGHERAGEVLDDFHGRLQGMARDGDVVERIGERKFAVLLSGLRNQGHARLAAQKIERLASETESRHIKHLDLKVTIGIASYPRHGKDATELMRLAETALLDGRRKDDTVCFYETESAQQLFTDWGLQSRLRAAIDAGDLEMHYQPKISVRTNEVVGAEALMRWDEIELGPISPEIFIELAESTGQIVDLTYFAIQRACRQVNEWRYLLPGLNIAVNITPSIIQGFEIIDVLQNATGIWNVEADALTMEITENALMSDPETSHAVLAKIREFGCRVSIDDFGTGYSSLAYLKSIPADELKIDRTFIMGMLVDTGDHKIVEHSIRIAKSFGLSVVAEGVECSQMLDELRKLGCNIAQGNFICPAVPASEFEIFCNNPT